MIARRARERDTGARGLRSIVEEVMTDIMFELPDMETKEQVHRHRSGRQRREKLFEQIPADKKSA